MGFWGGYNSREGGASESPRLSRPAVGVGRAPARPSDRMRICELRRADGAVVRCPAACSAALRHDLGQGRRACVDAASQRGRRVCE